MDRATLVLKSRSGAHPAGTLVPSSGDISSYLETDCVLLVHIGAAAAVGAAGGSSTDPAAAEATEAMPPLPRWSAPWQHGASTCPAAATETPAHQAPPSSGCAPSPPMLPSSPPFPPSTLPTITLRPVDPSPCSLTMHGLFPRFDGPVLPLLREAIRGVASFCERPVPGADGVLAFDYSEIGSAASAFPDPNGGTPFSPFTPPRMRPPSQTRFTLRPRHSRSSPRPFLAHSFPCLEIPFAHVLG
jgi:hypothetical protein